MIAVNEPTLQSLDSRSCPSCGAQGTGRFCSACGEKFLADEDFDLKHFLIHHVPHEVMHWDGKLGRTLRELVFVPGRMAAEYARGCRQPYLNPLRLYLVVFVVQAFLSTIGTAQLTVAQRVQRFDATGLVTRLTHRRLASADSVHSELLTTLTHWLSEAGTLLIVFLVAGALQLILRKYHRRYLEHLTLALNAVTFTLLVMVVGDLVTLIVGHGSVSDLAESNRINAGAYLLPFYWFIAIRHFYATSRGGALVYTLLITAATLVIAQVLNILVLLLLVAAT